MFEPRGVSTLPATGGRREGLCTGIGILREETTLQWSREGMQMGGVLLVSACVKQIVSNIENTRGF